MPDPLPRTTARMVTAGPSRWVLTLSGGLDTHIQYVREPGPEVRERILVDGQCVAWRRDSSYFSLWRVEVPGPYGELRLVLHTTSATEFGPEWLANVEQLRHRLQRTEGWDRGISEVWGELLYSAEAPELLNTMRPGILALFVEGHCVYRWNGSQGDLPIPAEPAAQHGRALPKPAVAPSADPRVAPLPPDKPAAPPRAPAPDASSA